VPTRSFQSKLLVLIIGVLVVLQAVTLLAVHFTGRRMLRKSLSEELQVGGRVLDRILTARGRQLSDTVRVLASDFAFREAIASGDRPTIVSVLTNHGSRIRANAAFLVSLDGSVLADTLGLHTTGKAFPFPKLIDTAADTGEASSIVTLEGRPYQLVVVPVLAPRAIAWVSMGFPIDAPLLSDVRRLTSLDVSLWKPPALVSTLPPTLQRDLLAQLQKQKQLIGGEVPLGGDTYATLVQPLRTGDGSSMHSLLQRSLAEAEKPYRSLERQIFLITSVGLLLSIIAAVYFARGVARPLLSLAEGVQRVERGDYSHAVDVRQRDEIGKLAAAFNRMRRGIADREEQIIHQATHDSLTGLPNRNLFLDRLQRDIAAAKRDGSSVGVLMMDLDRFKEINDTLGHHFGDLLLNEIGHRLMATLRETDTVARLGGDEFGMTFSASEPTQAAEVALRIRDALAEPINLDDISIDVDASMGITFYPLHGEDAGTLMRRADVAMYDAKRNHVPFAIYEEERDDHTVRRLSLMSELKHAIARDELELRYQPKIDLQTAKMVHVEALVRWRHPVHGLMPPDEFVPLAEQSGNISLMTKWVLRHAIHQCGVWIGRGLPLTIAVNLSALDLFDSELPGYITGLLQQERVEPSCLVLEITESAVMKDPAYGLKILRDLKSRGITLAIDDFGTGYSSLAHLKRLPVDELKIDKSFVISLPSEDDRVIVRSTIELGHNMGLKVIAEGVETAESWEILKQLGCDMAQGYFMSAPLAADDLFKWAETSPWADAPHATMA
jgi:diguanylate cyclase (GGDEF)-like protein